MKISIGNWNCSTKLTSNVGLIQLSGDEPAVTCGQRLGTVGIAVTLSQVDEIVQLLHLTGLPEESRVEDVDSIEVRLVETERSEFYRKPKF